MTQIAESYASSTPNDQQQNSMEKYFAPSLNRKRGHVSSFAFNLCCCFYTVTIQVATLNQSGSPRTLSSPGDSTWCSAACSSVNIKSSHNVSKFSTIKYGCCYLRAFARFRRSPLTAEFRKVPSPRIPLRTVRI